MTKLKLSYNYNIYFSVYFRQNATKCNFNANGSWVVLSPIEQRIKAKIERIGTPLKNWDINIYRRILTGYNEAFIIDEEKKNELIAEDPKSAEIIRPLLRGRDIKRYKYVFADKYLIATFPSRKYNIDDFPAVKNFLMGFYPKLKQTGESLSKQEVEGVLNHAKQHGIPINVNSLKKSRKKTNNKWFETQDSISYWEDFNKQKIIYPNMTKYLPFVFDEKDLLTNQKCFIITGKNVEFLTAFFNSSLFKYCFRESFPELQGGTRELSKIFFGRIPVIEISKKTNQEFKELILKLQNKVAKQESSKDIGLQIDKKILDLYPLSEEEKKSISFIEIQ